MGSIIISYVPLRMTVGTVAIGMTEARRKYSDPGPGSEVSLPPDAICARPDHGCGRNISVRFTEFEWKTESLLSRDRWVSGESNTSGPNPLLQAARRASLMVTDGLAGALRLRRKPYLAGGQAAPEISISCNGGEGRSPEKVVNLYRERKGAPTVIYTLGLHTKRKK
jgi:hypothetical protein